MAESLIFSVNSEPGDSAKFTVLLTDRMEVPFRVIVPLGMLPSEAAVLVLL